MPQVVHNTRIELETMQMLEEYISLINNRGRANKSKTTNDALKEYLEARLTELRQQSGK